MSGATSGAALRFPRTVIPHVAPLMRATGYPFAGVGGPIKIAGMENPTSFRSRLLWLAGALAASPAIAAAADAAQVEKGAAVYALRCEGCHGQGLRNTSGGWSFDLRKLKPDEYARFVDSVTTGKDNMPSWYGILKDDEIEAIWSYIRATVDK
jgi:mono/diheme cytochrome c family protein